LLGVGESGRLVLLLFLKRLDMVLDLLLRLASLFVGRSSSIVSIKVSFEHLLGFRKSSEQSHVLRSLDLINQALQQIPWNVHLRREGIIHDIYSFIKFLELKTAFENSLVSD